MFTSYSEHHPAKKDLLAELLKMVMVVPFSDKVVPAPSPPPPDIVEILPTSPAKTADKEPTVSKFTCQLDQLCS